MVQMTVVVRAAGPRRCRGDVYHHESITDLGSPAKNSTILGLSKLRTRLCERSAHTAGRNTFLGSQRHRNPLPETTASDLAPTEPAW
jgi:hypothetical protein